MASPNYNSDAAKNKMLVEATAIDCFIMQVYNADPVQYVTEKVSTAATRFHRMWETGLHRAFHYSFIPAITVGGLWYSGDLSLGMMLASLNPLLM
ncbi:unnamed protein product [Amoebophrya sp. A25]|nr:unnamed protein product [Amoebophrya sp. A25]|eukprot:GSA25T00002218001.1